MDEARIGHPFALTELGRGFSFEQSEGGLHVFVPLDGIRV